MVSLFGYKNPLKRTPANRYKSLNLTPGRRVMQAINLRCSENDFGKYYSVLVIKQPIDYGGKINLFVLFYWG